VEALGAQERKTELVMSPEKIILLIVMALMMEGNFLYYDFKGKQPFSPGRLIYKTVLPDTVTGMLRRGGKWWGEVIHGRVPLTLLPDHIMLCVPIEMDWEKAPAGSPEAMYRDDVENVMRQVAKRHAKPGITFDENRFHYDGGGWIGFASRRGAESYGTSSQWMMPVADLAEYWGVGWSRICGNTAGHDEGPGHYRAFAVTFDGDIVKAD
jgi:hypothetical protein